MLQLQQSLNDTTNGKNWEEGVTQNGKQIDWRRCIYLEGAELIDSYPWKHWKNIDASPDYENIKIEIVDIWHFVMSEALRVYKVNERGSIHELTTTISTMLHFRSFADESKRSDLDYYAQIAVVEDMLRIAFCDKDINSLIASFFIVSSRLNLKLPELYKLYIGKNILNKFRQEHGYKDGSYIKVWSGKEDNVVMQEILNRNPEITPSDLYSKLEEVYPSS
jgi:dimeric dUTPase (all-alpha-NTP-PPase superfamily)